jgi:hypothetical protein
MKILYLPEADADGDVQPTPPTPVPPSGTSTDPTFEYEERLVTNVDVNLDDMTVTLYTGTWYVVFGLKEFQNIEAMVQSFFDKLRAMLTRWL